MRRSRCAIRNFRGRNAPTLWATQHALQTVQRFGFRKPVSIDDQQLIIAGYGRVYVTKPLGIEDMPTREAVVPAFLVVSRSQLRHIPLTKVAVLGSVTMSDYIFGSAFEVWKSELDAINQEASVLLAAARRASVKEDRRALQTQYAALVERRNTAIRKLLHSAFPRRYSIASEKPAELTGQGTRSADAPPAPASSASEKHRTFKIDTENDPGTTCRLNQLRQAQKETVVLNRDDGWISDKPAEDDCQRLPYKGMDKNFAPESRKLALRPDVKFEEVVAEARDSITRAGSVVSLLGIKGGREEDAIETGPSEQTVATDSCSSEGPSTEPPQVLPSTDATAVDCSLDATSEALFEGTLNSDPDDELLRILSGEGPNRDLDEVIRDLSRGSSNSGHPEIGPLSGRTSDFDIAPPAFQGAPISARILPLCRVQFRPHYPASSPRR